MGVPVPVTVAVGGKGGLHTPTLGGGRGGMGGMSFPHFPEPLELHRLPVPTGGEVMPNHKPHVNASLFQI